MSFELKKPYTSIERADFIVKHNHNSGLLIEETDTALYALESNEIMVDGTPQINPNYEKELATQKRAVRIEEIKTELSALDLQAVRPLRAIAAGTATDADHAKLADLEAQAEKLRAELSALGSN